MPTAVTTARRRTGRATSRHGAWPSRARPARVQPTASATWDVTDLVFGRGRLCSSTRRTTPSSTTTGDTTRPTPRSRRGCGSGSASTASRQAGCATRRRGAADRTVTPDASTSCSDQGRTRWLRYRAPRAEAPAQTDETRGAAEPRPPTRARGKARTPRQPRKEMGREARGRGDHRRAAQQAAITGERVAATSTTSRGRPPPLRNVVRARSTKAATSERSGATKVAEPTRP